LIDQIGCQAAGGDFQRHIPFVPGFADPQFPPMYHFLCLGMLSHLLGVLRPYRSEAMRRYRVSSRVNSVKNDDSECAAEHKPPTLFG
jgi:hypothetical protein